jgi:hypothetical protein
LIGITDNSEYEEDAVYYIDNVWLFKPSTGQKYSTFNGSEDFISPAKEKDFIIMSKINDEIFFRINYNNSTVNNQSAFKLDTKKKKLYFYLENDSFETAKVVFVYIRKV